MRGLRKYVNRSPFKQFLRNFDITGLIETWSDRVNEFVNFIENFTLFDCVLHNSSGVCVFIRETLLQNNFMHRICHEFADCVVMYMKCSLYESIKYVTFVTVYVSPAGSKMTLWMKIMELNCYMTN